MLPVSKRLTLSYALDWFVIVAIAAIGGGLNFITPYRRPFSLLDLNISYPHVEESISTRVLVVISLLAPAAIITAIVLAAIPSRAVSRHHPSRNVSSSSNSKNNISYFMQFKLWELQIGLAGLCLSIAVAFFATQALKQLFGKPRPDLLSRCQPDLANIAAHIVSAPTANNGTQSQDPRWSLVAASICTNPDTATLNDGFRSFPSGHASFAWSGLLYLTLYFCAKFGVAIPSLPQQPAVSPILPSTPEPHALRVAGALWTHTQDPSVVAAPSQPGNSTASSAEPKPLCTEAQSAAGLRGSRPATPPTYLLVPACVPVAVAVYVTSTRYVEFYHFGFDVIAGALLGLGSAWAAFRWYHAPATAQGAGAAWGARSVGRAFGGVVVGALGGYADEAGESSGGDAGWRGGDLESGKREA